MSGFEPFIVPSIVYAWKGCCWLWAKYQEKQGLAVQTDLSGLGSALQLGANAILNQWDDLADNYGDSFTIGDDEVQGQLAEVAEKLLVQQVQKELRLVLSNSAQVSSDWEKNAADICKKAKESVISSLQDFSQRLRNSKSMKLGQLQAHSGEEDIVYCHGAILLQKDDARTFTDIVTNGRVSRRSYTCRHCFLEITNHHLSRLPKEQWTVLAKCHVLAFDSFLSRRAGYKCVACASYGQFTFEASAARFLDHLAQCGYSMTGYKPVLVPQPLGDSDPFYGVGPSLDEIEAAFMGSTDANQGHGQEIAEAKTVDRADDNPIVHKPAVSPNVTERASMPVMYQQQQPPHQLQAPAPQQPPPQLQAPAPQQPPPQLQAPAPQQARSYQPSPTPSFSGISADVAQHDMNGRPEYVSQPGPYSQAYPQGAHSSSSGFSQQYSSYHQQQYPSSLHDKDKKKRLFGRSK